MIVLYGDHYGISENHKKAMEQILGKEITPLKMQIYNVSHYLFVFLEWKVERTILMVAKLIFPTLLHLLGSETKDYIQFGSDLLSEDHNEVVPFRNGDFVSPAIYFNDKFYDNKQARIR